MESLKNERTHVHLWANMICTRATCVDRRWKRQSALLPEACGTFVPSKPRHGPHRHQSDSELELELDESSLELELDFAEVASAGCGNTSASGAAAAMSADEPANWRNDGGALSSSPAEPLPLVGAPRPCPANIRAADAFNSSNAWQAWRCLQEAHS